MTDRIKKKCFLGSSLMHLGLILGVIVVSAFSANRTPPPVEITLFDLNAPVTDGESKSGPAAMPQTADAPQPSPQQPAPQPQPEPVKSEPEVVKPKSAPSKPTPAPETKSADVLPDKGDFVIKPKKKEKKPEDKRFNLAAAEDFSKTKKQLKDEARKKADEEQQKADEEAAQQALEAHQKRIDAVKSFRKGLQGGVGNGSDIASAVGRTGSAGVIVSLGGTGNGDSDSAASNYRDHVVTAYYNAWNPPDSVAGAPTVEVRIVVVRDGQITTAEITRRSGNTSMDNSVQRALDKVPRLPAFPASAKDLKRTYRIIFDIKNKELIG